MFDFDFCGGVGSYVREVVGGSDVEICRVAILFRPSQPVNNDWPLRAYYKWCMNAALTFGSSLHVQWRKNIRNQLQVTESMRFDFKFK